jgi:V8-like Glu-specific endopeptidase
VHHALAPFRRALIGCLTAAVVAALALLMSPSANAQTAVPAKPDPKVGALFRAGVPGHYCSAGVVHSPGRNLVMTAAHCVVGNGTQMRFVPALHDGVRPYGTWTVSRVFLHPAWINRHDWQHDFAFLQIQPRLWNGVRRNIEDVVGANRLATAPARGQRVTVTGYVAGSGDKPITCTVTAYYSSGYPAFDCHGYRGGVSGSPWVTNGQIYGVIGGLHQGGCVESTSYSSAFSADTDRLFQRASAGTDSDDAPGSVSDGC